MKNSKAVRQLRFRHSDLSCLIMAALVTLAGTLCDAADTADSRWRYTFEEPTAGWQQTTFDDSGWKLGDGGFGTRGTPAARIGTIWKSNHIWLRRSLEITVIPEHPGLQIHHDEDAEVFINGVKVAALSEYTTDYKVIPIPADHRGALRKGKNVMAVHCRQNVGGQYIDVHFVDADNPPPLPAAKPFRSELITKWGSEVTAENAWTEYPRPQLVREDWQNLNGQWEYAITPITRTNLPDQWDGQILVPFCLESRLGGVQKLLSPSEALWYRRQFKASPKAGHRTLLNFEAVDYRCEVFVNGTSVGQHQGGNTPFTFDVTRALKNGDNVVVVRVEDETEGWQLRGKQVINPGGIFYTQVSGIWQTVWLEQVNASHIADLKILTDASAGRITIRPEIAGTADNTSLRVVVKDGHAEVASVVGSVEESSVQIDNARLWSPASPHLYGLEISLLDASGRVLDKVTSYTGIRTAGKVKDAAGHWRFTLNDDPVFHWGPLDQGWWPDGLLTPPSDEGMLFDIEWLKSAGFNMIRKHIKVEPRRYYYHCDRLGMLVWQDQVSGGKSPKWTRFQRNPEDANWPDENHAQFMLEFERMIDALESHPSIVVWGPFNEAWGQHRTMDVGKWTVQRDPGRLVNIASGGNFWPVGDIADAHAYPNPSFPLADARYNEFIKVVGEFGGHGYPVKGHLWDTERDNWGYGGLPKTMQEYRDLYVKSLELLNDLRHKGIAGGVYTQTTDVEGEINGLMTYDRKVIKIPAEELRELHRQLFNNQ